MSQLFILTGNEPLIRRSGVENSSTAGRSLCGVFFFGFFICLLFCSVSWAGRTFRKSPKVFGVQVCPVSGARGVGVELTAASSRAQRCWSYS